MPIIIPCIITLIFLGGKEQYRYPQNKLFIYCKRINWLHLFIEIILKAYSHICSTLFIHNLKIHLCKYQASELSEGNKVSIEVKFEYEHFLKGQIV